MVIKIPQGRVRVIKVSNCEYLITSLFVLPDYRQKGYGKQLIELAENYVKQHAEAAFLYVLKNTWMHSWYIGIGYSDTQSRCAKGYVLLKKKFNLN